MPTIVERAGRAWRALTPTGVAVAAAGLWVVAAVPVLGRLLPGRTANDLRVFMDGVDALVRGPLLYRDFVFEYPPYALLWFVVPRAFSDGLDGFRFAFGVYYSAILDETGWGRAETAGVASAAMIVYACTAALSGYLFDRVGARVLFPIGALCMGMGLVLCSTAESLAGLTASYGILLGLSYRRTLGAVRWIRKHQGWVTRAGGLMLVAVGLLLVTGWWDLWIAEMRGWVVGFEVSV